MRICLLLVFVIVSAVLVFFVRFVNPEQRSHANRAANDNANTASLASKEKGAFGF